MKEKVSGDNIYKALVFFDKMYEAMSDTEKRDFITQLLSAVKVYEERQPNGQWLKSMEFKLPIIELDLEISLDNDEQVDT